MIPASRVPVNITSKHCDLSWSIALHSFSSLLHPHLSHSAIMSPLLLSLFLLPLVATVIPPFPQQVAPSSIQTEVFASPQFPAPPLTVTRQRIQNGPPGFQPPKAVAKIREEMMKDLEKNHFGFITRKGRARVLGISRHRDVERSLDV
ncbi:hypothetical protein PENTCL1PPCAC_8191 [Pristionchus entomophagus]|uniref:Uncharacterized protein n=1 Tax=Pristionchus entomophagus TaxID=358040 RepID=A0AAV5T2R4_9BILA|nr:hypothetical protein PENTCL1PPCAC_8191 [Pristionchus entomophagus]